MPKSRCKFSCETCGTQLADRKALRNHIKFIHEKYIQEICEHCGRKKSFTCILILHNSNSLYIIQEGLSISKDILITCDRSIHLKNRSSVQVNAN